MKPESAILTLGNQFYDEVEPASFPAHILRYQNNDAARSIGLGHLTHKQWQDHFATFEPFSGSLQSPLALRYHGHQFGVYNPQLGDGRGFLFAQFREKNSNRLLDLGTKGSGQTPWSRQGDGRLTLKGGIREALATEMLTALGVNTSKTLSVIETKESLYRTDEPSPARSSVLTRLNHSHIRIGTFQRFAYLEDSESLLVLLDYTLAHYYPHITPHTLEDKVTQFLTTVTEKLARTTAQWMLAGFVHGVLNTDNINITGESFDYGPWCFIDTLDMNTIAAYFDHEGRYAYGKQPNAVIWNILQLAHCFKTHIHPDTPAQLASLFNNSFNNAFNSTLLKRLGLAPRNMAENTALAKGVLAFLSHSQIPFEAFFFDWFTGMNAAPSTHKSLRKRFYENEAFKTLENILKTFEPHINAHRKHPYFTDHEGPCTMLRADVEDIWHPIAERDDWSVFNEKIAHISEMRQAIML